MKEVRKIFLCLLPGVPYNVWGSKASQNGEVWSKVDRYRSHPFWYFLSGKWDLLDCRACFMGNSFFGDLGSKTLHGSFGALNDIFWGQNLANTVPRLLVLLYTLRHFQQCKDQLNQSFYREIMPLASWHILLITMIPSGCHVSFHYSHMWISITLWRVQNHCHNQELRHAKTLTLTLVG